MKSLFMSFPDKGLHRNDEGGRRAHEGGSVTCSSFCLLAESWNLLVYVMFFFFVRLPGKNKSLDGSDTM